MESNSMPSSGSVLTKSIGMQPSNYKVGDTVKMVITSYGEFRLWHESFNLNPLDRIVDMKIESLKKIKVEYVEA